MKIDAQDREEVKTPVDRLRPSGYEANMLNGVDLFRKGRAFVWLTDDARHLRCRSGCGCSFRSGR